MVKHFLFAFYLFFSLGLLAQNEQDSINIHQPDAVDSLFSVLKDTNVDSVEQPDEYYTDSLKYCFDSLRVIIEDNHQLEDSLTLLKIHIVSFENTNDSLQKANDRILNEIHEVKSKYLALKPINKELNTEIQNLQQKVEEQNQMINNQVQKLKEKELLFIEKENIYKEAIQASRIDLVKLEGQLSTMNSKLEGKNREIELLASSISEQKAAIETKNSEIDEVRNRRKVAISKLDTLKDNLQEKEKELILTSQELKYTRKELSIVKKQLNNLTNRKQKIRIVQGIAIRNVRTPLYTLKPKSSLDPDVYVIHNENSGGYEFDFITGATFRVLDLSKKKAQYTSDIGFFLGFGGKNLFKNFYLGPNIKLFDVIHVNAGLNIAEFRLLKEGFSEGDMVNEGVSIPTVNKWELTPYFSLTFDLSLISKIAGKL